MVRACPVRAAAHPCYEPPCPIRHRRPDFLPGTPGPGGVTLLIETKVYADEQPGQCDRLADAWADEKATLVFLTIDGQLPYTAVASAGLWHQLAWPQVAAVIANAARASDCAPGVLDLLATIEIFGR